MFSTNLLLFLSLFPPHFALNCSPKVPELYLIGYKYLSTKESDAHSFYVRRIQAQIVFVSTMEVIFVTEVTTSVFVHKTKQLGQCYCLPNLPPPAKEQQQEKMSCIQCILPN